VLEGSLRRAGDRVRITCQLIETATGTHVWAEKYDRSLGDIFALQDEITLSVVGAIEPSLRQAEIERAKRKRPENLDAYDLYLRALPHAQVAMPGDGEKALEWLHKSLALEPDYAAAHALAAWCYEQRYLRGGMHEADKIAGLRHARAALAAGADDPTTLATAGFVVGLVEHDYQTAMNAIDHALALNGSSTLALSLGATILAHDGQISRAVEYGERALRLSSHDPTAYLELTALGIAHLAAGRSEQAVTVCNRACQSNPHFSFPVVLQTAALFKLGRVDEAKALARRVLELEPNFSVARFVKSHTGRADIWNPIGDTLRQVGLPE
jgi:tetratricopeptide (TPR) repeat protein